MRFLKHIASFTALAASTAIPALAAHSDFDDRSWFSPSVIAVQIDDETREDAGTTGIGGQLAFGTALSQSFAAQIRIWDSTTNRVDDDHNRARGVGLDLMYRRQLSSSISAHAIIGGGIQRTDVPAISGINDYTAQNETIDLGLGITRKLTPHGTASLFEIRHRLEEFDRPTPGSDELAEWIVNIGLVIPFGKQKTATISTVAVQEPEVVLDIAVEPASTPEPVYEPIAEPQQQLVAAPPAIVVPPVVAVPPPAAAPPVQVAESVFEPQAEPIYFEMDSAEPSAAGRAALDRLANELIQLSGIEAHLSGFANDSGNETYNRELAQRRAEAIRAALVHRGVSSRRIKTNNSTQSSENNDTALDSGRRVEVEFK